LSSISCQSLLLLMLRCWIMYLIYFHLKKKRIKKNWAPKMKRARKVCNLERLRSISCYSLTAKKKFRSLPRFSCWSSSSKIFFSSCLSIWNSYSKNKYVWCPKSKKSELCLKTSKLRTSCSRTSYQPWKYFFRFQKSLIGIKLKIVGNPQTKTNEYSQKYHNNTNFSFC
jgi:hypothetical protein